MTITRRQERRGAAAEWTSTNPVLASGEWGYERDTGKVKIGDGVTAWNALGYLTGSGGAPTAAAEIATYQTNAMWEECFGRITKTGVVCADNALTYGAPSPTFTGDPDVYALGDYGGTPCLDILKAGWHHIMLYAHQWDATPDAGQFAVYPSIGTDLSVFYQGGYFSAVMPGTLLSVAGQVEADPVIWVPPDDVPHHVIPVIWQKSGATRTCSVWLGAWPFLIDGT